MAETRTILGPQKNTKMGSDTERTTTERIHRRNRRVPSKSKPLSSLSASQSLQFHVTTYHLVLQMIVVLLLSSLLISSTVATGDTADVAADVVTPPPIPDQEKYLYYGTTGHYVQEYVSDQVIANGGKNEGHFIDHPDFLYNENYPKGRVVEFYAHWCPHCKHFKPHFMDFSNNIHDITEDVEVYAVSCVPNADLCKRQGITGYPSVVVYPPYTINATKYKNRDKLHPMEVLKVLGMKGQDKTQKKNTGDQPPPQQKQLSSDAVQVHNLQGDSTTNNKKTSENEIVVFMHRTKKEVFDDAHLSFNFAMTTAVYVGEGPLEGSRRKILKRFLLILEQTLPFDSSMNAVVHDLLEDFDNICKSDKNLMAVMDRHPPPVDQWSPASRLHGTGYTAGLWQLFHIISVGVVEWNRMTLNDKQRISVVHVADNLRDYVANFFQCDVCRLNFMSEYDACSHDRCNRLVDMKENATLAEWIQFPLWLYETHNSVNVRLRKERIELHDETEDQTSETQVMWPPIETCPSCWLSPGRWDEQKVYEYLHDTYWSGKGSTVQDTVLQTLPSVSSERMMMSGVLNDIHPMLMMSMENGLGETLKAGAVLTDDELKKIRLSKPKALCAVAAFVVLYVWYRKRRSWITRTKQSKST